MDKEIILREVQYKAIRSSGPGGQHVNKVSSKIELAFNISTSEGLTELEKQDLLKNLSNKLTKENILILTCQESRSQHRNKELVCKRLFEMLLLHTAQKKKRKKTNVPKSVKLKRLLSKKRLSEKKETRKKLRY